MNTRGDEQVRVCVKRDQILSEELTCAEMGGKQFLRLRYRKFMPKKRYVLIGILLFLLLTTSLSSVLSYLVYQARYHADLSLARSGVQHLQKAEALLATWLQSPLDTQLTKQAKDEFTSASRTFTLLNSDMQSLPALVMYIPIYGARVTSALRLVPLAITLSQMGIIGCNILNILLMGLHDPLTSQGHGIVSSDLTSVGRNVRELSSELLIAIRLVNQLQPSDLLLDSRISKLVGVVRNDVPVIQGWLNTFEQLLPVAPMLLGVGTPTNYLIEVLDSTELRPGGGFIGNYGIATFSGGRLIDAHITDVDLLDKPFEFADHVIPYPAAYNWFDLAPTSWSFRDSNLDADFPTAARYGEQTYIKEGGKVPLQGVMAITPSLIEHALAITGPIAIPEYQETITAYNLIARIHYHQLGGNAAGEGSSLIPSPNGRSSQRKQFTELLGEHLLARIRQLSSSDLSKFLLLFVSSVRSKDLQLYFNSSTVENLLHIYHLDAAIQAPVGDSLFVVDTNIAGNKANNFIINILDDQITIDSQGDTIHHTTLRYAWITAGPIYGNPLYRDYVRVYVPAGSVLFSQDGWEPRGTSNAFHSAVWKGFFTLSYRQTRSITLVWKVHSIMHKNEKGWYYQYLVQRQAGTLWKLNLHITLPPCAAITRTWSGLISSNKQEAKLTQLLSEDLNVGVDYTCM